MKINETLQLVLALLGGLLLIVLWAGKKLILAVFILGLVLPLIPKETVEGFLRLPIISSASPLFLWLIEHGLHLGIVVSILMIFSLFRQIDRVQSYQVRQAQILGGLVKYLEISDFQLSPDAEELVRHGIGKYLKRWFTKRLVWAGDWEEIVVSNVFNTALKRGDAVVTLRNDIRQYLREITGQAQH